MNSTENRYPNEITISLKELCWRLLEQWKLVILVSVCIAACFSGIMYGRANKAAKTGDNTQESVLTHQEIIENLPKSKRSLVVDACQLLKKRDQLSEYLQTAPVMQIDSNHAKRLRVSWAINGNQNDTYSLAMLYLFDLQSEECKKELLKASGTQINLDQFNDIMFFTYPDGLGEDVVCCDIFLLDNMDAEALQTEFKHQVDFIYAKLQDEVGEHKIINYSSEIAIVSAKKLCEEQIKYYYYYSNINSQLNSLRSTFSTEQEEAFNKLQIDSSDTVNASQNTNLSKTTIIRNVVIGFLVGLILYLIAFFLYIMLSNHIISTDMIKGSSARIFGDWFNDLAEDKRFGLLQSRFIWKKHHSSSLDRDAQLDSIVDAIDSTCKYKEIKKILVIETVEQEKGQKDFLEQVFNRLTLLGLNIHFTKLYTPDNVFADKDLLDIDGIIVVVVDSRTRIKSMELIFDKCNNYNKLIIGNIYMG